MSRRAKILLGAAIAFMLVLIIGIISMVRRGFSTYDDPTAIEAFAARTMRAVAVPADLRNEENPVPLTAAVVAEGRAHWADHCALCHANDGKGSELGRSMYPHAPDMSSERVQKLSDGELFATIENGIRLTGMPAFGGGTAESAYGTWGLVHFIRHLPKITPEEIAEMEKLNPKSPAEWQQMQEEQEFLGVEQETAVVRSHDAQPHH